MNYRSVASLNNQIVGWLGRLPGDLDLIVGIPRSGLLAANILALHLNLPLTDVDGLLEGRIIQSGARSKSNDPTSMLSKGRNILVLDDSVLRGKQMELTRGRITAANTPHTIYYAAVYVAPGHEHQLDFFCEILPTPRCFEWNVMHHSMLVNCCIDVDGVLCKDPNEYENDDGIHYDNFIKHAEPLLIPTEPVGWLVTCRLEKYRTLTEEWLDRQGVKYNKLFMMSFPSKAARMASNSYGAYKAAIYRETGADLFIESSFKQAVEIAKLSGKDVLCMETREVVAPDIIAKSYRKAHEFRSTLLRKLDWALTNLRHSVMHK